MESFYRLLSKGACLVAGEKEMSVFIFQKAMLNIMGFDWVEGGLAIKFIPNFVKFSVYPYAYIMLQYIVTILTLKPVIEGDVVDEITLLRKVKGVIVSMTFVFSATKILFLRSRRQEFTDLLNIPRKMTNVREDDIYVTNAQKNSVYYALLLLSTAGTWTLYVIVVERDIPFPTDFPWDRSFDKNFVAWFSPFVIDFFTAVYCALGHILVETIFLCSVAVICCSAARLRKNLRSLGSRKIDDEKVMRQAIESHIYLLRAYRQVIKCYRSLFFVQTVYTVAHACVCIFSLVKAIDKISVTLNAMPMLTSAYVQLFVYCYYGQLMTSVFNDLPFAAYDNNWIACPLPVKRSLYLFELVSTRNVAIKGFGDSSASYATYMNSFRESVSYFLVLKTVTADD